MTRRRKLVALAAIPAAILLALYCRMMFSRGVWYRDVFLRQTGDGTFAAADGQYSMQIASDASGADIRFCADGETRQYRVGTDAGAVRILSDGAELFCGRAVPMGDAWLLTAENGEMSDGLLDIAPDTQTPFPTPVQLYTWASGGTQEWRGEPAMLLAAVLAGAVLALDIRFPNLFFRLRHGLSVDGGQPSDLYRTGQNAARILLGAAAVGFLIAGLAI